MIVLAALTSQAPDAGAPASALLLAVAFTGSLCSGVAGAWLTGRLNHRHQRRDVVRADVDRAVDALAALRDMYRRRAGGEEVDEFALAGMEDALALAAERTTRPVVEAARGYLGVGRLYAGGDPDAPAVREQAMFEALTAALVAERNAYA